MARKKDALRLEHVLSEEVKKGWGRTIRGAKTTEKQLQRDSPAEAAELRQHIVLVELARTLQPDKLTGLTDPEVESGFARLAAAGCGVPRNVQVALLCRQVKQLFKRADDTPTEENIRLLLHTLCPWFAHNAHDTRQQGSTSTFAPAFPLMWNTDMLAIEKASMFAKWICKLASPLVLAGAEQAHPLRILLTVVHELLEAVKVVNLCSDLAYTHTDLRSFSSLLDACLLPVSQCSKHAEQIKQCVARFSRATLAADGLEMKLCHWIAHGPFKVHIANSERSLDIITQIMPAINDAIQNLIRITELGADEQADSLVVAHELLKLHKPVAPEGQQCCRCGRGGGG